MVSSSQCKHTVPTWRVGVCRSRLVLHDLLHLFSWYSFIHENKLYSFICYFRIRMDKSLRRLSIISSAYLPSLWIISMSILPLLQRWKFQQSLLLAHYNCCSIHDSIYCFEAFPSNTLGIAIRKQKIGSNLTVQSVLDQRSLNEASHFHLIHTDYP